MADSQPTVLDPTLGEALDEFLATLKPQQAVAYGSWVRKYVEFAGPDVRVSALTGARVESYAASQLSPADPNIDERIEALKRWFQFLKKRGYTAQNFGVHIRVRTAAKKLPAAARAVEGKPKSVELTAAGLAALKAELAELERQRVELVKAVAQAREDKDFRENAPLHAAREALAWNEQRRKQIEAVLRDAVVVEGGSNGRAAVGSTVSFVRLDNGSRDRVMLVSPREANPAQKKISVESPVGRALLDRAPGDEVVVQTPSGEIHFRIEAVE